MDNFSAMNEVYEEVCDWYLFRFMPVFISWQDVASAQTGENVHSGCQAAGGRRCRN
jgi:hypothetical protein